MGVEKLNAPADFQAAIEKPWDERDPISRILVNAGDPVHRMPWRYALDEQIELHVNDVGPPVTMEICTSTGGFECNFWEGDRMLVARDLSRAADSSRAPIAMRFSHAVTAVGAWLGAFSANASDESFFNQRLYGAMWVALESDETRLHLVDAIGSTGFAARRGTLLTAPFVGARATAGDRIVEVRFDVALLGNRRYEKIAVSELTVER